MMGKLEKIDIRKEWKKESKDFTYWLAREENLNMLGEEINLKLKLVDTEANVGNYYADIVAQTKNDEKVEYIIIENQLEATDHDHLGKLITYGSGFDAKTLIWIFKDIDEEHRKGSARVTGTEFVWCTMSPNDITDSVLTDKYFN